MVFFFSGLNHYSLFAQKNISDVTYKKDLISDVANGKITSGRLTPDQSLTTNSTSLLTQILFYGNTAGHYTLSGTSSGYIGGTNSYKDQGKYERFDFTGAGILKEVRINFSDKMIVSSADNFNLVVKSVGAYGVPSTTLYTKTYSTSIIDISNPGVNYNTFAISPGVNVSTTFFVGIEWDPNIDDMFSITMDANGEGNNQNRAWEKLSNGTYIDMYTSWSNLDADLWIAALIDAVIIPSPPILLQPANSTTGVSTNPTLSWNTSSGATSYHLQVSINSSFSTTVFDQSNITGISQQVSGLSGNTAYYWRVNATNSSGTSGWSTPVWSFNTVSTPPLPPTLISPSNGATAVSINPTLSWNASSGATSYHLQVSINSSFSTTVFDQSGITGTSQQVSGLSNNTAYYWRVTATSTIGTSDWSTPIWNFTTIGTQPLPPTLVLPLNGATAVSINPTLSWNSSSGATSYRLQVSISSSFSTTVFDQSSITGTSQQVSGLSINTTYFWRVNATNTNGTSSWSSQFSFTTNPNSTQSTTLFYGDGNGTRWYLTSPHTGYVFGPNSYGDIGKYQRFDFTGSGQLTEIKIYFCAKKIVGSADNFNLVVKSVGTDGAPNTLLYSASYSVSIIDTSNWGTVFNTFTIPPLSVTGAFFIGLEWESTIDDLFDVVADAKGFGNNQKRAWEKLSNGTFVDVFTSWTDLDVDIWIKAVLSVDTDVEENNNVVPSNYVLYQNYPNPFNPSTNIKYALLQNSFVSIKVYDILGREVKTLVSSELPAGNHSIVWKGDDNNGHSVSSGTYIYRIHTDNFVQTKKMILMK